VARGGGWGYSVADGEGEGGYSEHVEKKKGSREVKNRLHIL